MTFYHFFEKNHNIYANINLRDKVISQIKIIIEGEVRKYNEGKNKMV